MMAAEIHTNDKIGWKNKYHLSKADGRECDPDGVYFVLKLNSKDPVHKKASLLAARAYADSVRGHNNRLDEDIRSKIMACQLEGIETCDLGRRER